LSNEACGRTLKVVLKPEPLIITTPTTLPNAEIEKSYTQSFTAIGGQPSYSWPHYYGTIPPGLKWSFDQAGTLSLLGTPTKEGTYTFTLEAFDSSNPKNSIKKQFTIKVNLKLESKSSPIDLFINLIKSKITETWNSLINFDNLKSKFNEFLNTGKKVSDLIQDFGQQILKKVYNFFSFVPDYIRNFIDFNFAIPFGALGSLADDLVDLVSLGLNIDEAISSLFEVLKKAGSGLASMVTSIFTSDTITGEGSWIIALGAEAKKVSQQIKEKISNATAYVKGFLGGYGAAFVVGFLNPSKSVTKVLKGMNIFDKTFDAVKVSQALTKLKSIDEIKGALRGLGVTEDLVILHADEFLRLSRAKDKVGVERKLKEVGVVAGKRIIKTVPRTLLPKNVQDSLKFFESTNWSKPIAQDGAKAGREYINSTKLLPIKSEKYYKEFDVNPKSFGRDNERFVRGINGEIYFSNDHYDSFVKIQ